MYLESDEVRPQRLVESQLLISDLHVVAPGDGEQLVDDLELTLQGRQLGGHLAQEGQVLHKLLHRPREVVQLLGRTLAEHTESSEDAVNLTF